MRAPAPIPVSRLRRPRVLIVGCGDVGQRLLAQLARRIADRQLSAIAVARDPGRRASARRLGARALDADLDSRSATRRLGALTHWTIHLAPPPDSGNDDPRLGRLIGALAAARASTQASTHASTPAVRPPAIRTGRHPPARWALVSTTGIYGDRQGAWTDESCPPAPGAARAHRRVAAEARFRSANRRGLVRGAILRAPGIYAHDRLPTERLRRGLPAPLPAEDSWTNHIHADDLAAVTWLALFRGRPGRAVNVVDDSALKMGDWFDRVADACGLPRPPRLPRAELAAAVSPMMLSFMNESRRLTNRRLKRELRARLRWPDVDRTLATLV